MAMAAVGRKVTMAAVAASKKCSSSASSTVDSLAVAKRLANKGLPAQQAEAITEAMTEALKSHLSKVEMQKFEILQESKLSKYQSEIESSQELNLEKLSHKIDKMGMEIEKMSKDIEKLSITSKADTEKMSLTMKAEMQAGKYEVVKYFIGAQVSVFAVAFAALRYLK